eukprot:UC4_evm6s1290
MMIARAMTRRGILTAARTVNASESKKLAIMRSRSYHEKVIDHYENPRNVGSLNKKSKKVGTGLVGAPACGDVMRLQIEVDEDGIITDAKFKTFGCGSAIASSSLATEMIKGKSVQQAASIKNAELAKELSLPPVKLHCSMLAEDAIQAAIKDHLNKNDKNIEDYSSSAIFSSSPATDKSVNKTFSLQIHRKTIIQNFNESSQYM